MFWLCFHFPRFSGLYLSKILFVLWYGTTKWWQFMKQYLIWNFFSYFFIIDKVNNTLTIHLIKNTEQIPLLTPLVKLY